MDVLALKPVMQGSLNARFRFQRPFMGENRKVNPVEDSLAPDKDLIMEQIIENINNTPIGQVLKKIASLPEARIEKVLDVRKQLTEGKYDFNEHLDVALDKVLEDLTA